MANFVYLAFFILSASVLNKDLNLYPVVNENFLLELDPLFQEPGLTFSVDISDFEIQQAANITSEIKAKGIGEIISTAYYYNSDGTMEPFFAILGQLTTNNQTNLTLRNATQTNSTFTNSTLTNSTLTNSTLQFNSTNLTNSKNSSNSTNTTFTYGIQKGNIVNNQLHLNETTIIEININKPCYQIQYISSDVLIINCGQNSGPNNNFTSTLGVVNLTSQNVTYYSDDQTGFSSVSATQLQVQKLQKQDNISKGLIFVGYAQQNLPQVCTQVAVQQYSYYYYEYYTTYQNECVDQNTAITIYELNLSNGYVQLTEQRKIQNPGFSPQYYYTNTPQLINFKITPSNSVIILNQNTISYYEIQNFDIQYVNSQDLIEGVFIDFAVYQNPTLQTNKTFAILLVRQNCEIQQGYLTYDGQSSLQTVKMSYLSEGCSCSHTNSTLLSFNSKFIALQTNNGTIIWNNKVLISNRETENQQSKFLSFFPGKYQSVQILPDYNQLILADSNQLTQIQLSNAYIKTKQNLTTKNLQKLQVIGQSNYFGFQELKTFYYQVLAQNDTRVYPKYGNFNDSINLTSIYPTDAIKNSFKVNDYLIGPAPIVTSLKNTSHQLQFTNQFIQDKFEFLQPNIDVDVVSVFRDLSSDPNENFQVYVQYKDKKTYEYYLQMYTCSSQYQEDTCTMNTGYYSQSTQSPSPITNMTVIHNYVQGSSATCFFTQDFFNSSITPPNSYHKNEIAIDNNFNKETYQVYPEQNLTIKGFDGALNSIYFSGKTSNNETSVGTIIKYTPQGSQLQFFASDFGLNETSFDPQNINFNTQFGSTMFIDNVNSLIVASIYNNEIKVHKILPYFTQVNGQQIEIKFDNDYMYIVCSIPEQSGWIAEYVIQSVTVIDFIKYLPLYGGSITYPLCLITYTTTQARNNLILQVSYQTKDYLFFYQQAESNQNSLFQMIDVSEQKFIKGASIIQNQQDKYLTFWNPKYNYNITVTNKFNNKTNYISGIISEIHTYTLDFTSSFTLNTEMPLNKAFYENKLEILAYSQFSKETFQSIPVNQQVTNSFLELEPFQNYQTIPENNKTIFIFDALSQRGQPTVFDVPSDFGEINANFIQTFVQQLTQEASCNGMKLVQAYSPFTWNGVENTIYTQSNGKIFLHQFVNSTQNEIAETRHSGVCKNLYDQQPVTDCPFIAQLGQNTGNFIQLCNTNQSSFVVSLYKGENSQNSTSNYTVTNSKQFTVFSQPILKAKLLTLVSTNQTFYLMTQTSFGFQFYIFNTTEFTQFEIFGFASDNVSGFDIINYNQNVVSDSDSQDQVTTYLILTTSGNLTHSTAQQIYQVKFLKEQFMFMEKVGDINLAKYLQNENQYVPDVEMSNVLIMNSTFSQNQFIIKTIYTTKTAANYIVDLKFRINNNVISYSSPTLQCYLANYAGYSLINNGIYQDQTNMLLLTFVNSNQYNYISAWYNMTQSCDSNHIPHWTQAQTVNSNKDNIYSDYNLMGFFPTSQAHKYLGPDGITYYVSNKMILTLSPNLYRGIPLQNYENSNVTFWIQNSDQSVSQNLTFSFKNESATEILKYTTGQKTDWFTLFGIGLFMSLVTSFIVYYIKRKQAINSISIKEQDNEKQLIEI